MSHFDKINDPVFRSAATVSIGELNLFTLTAKFLEIYLNTDLAYIQYERVIKGAGVPDLHLEDIRKIKIPLPPKEVQKTRYS